MDTNKRVLQGTVVSRKNEKTAVVRVDKFKKHPLYHKRIRQSKKYHVHDEENKTNEGDFVAIVEDRRRSKRKYFSLHQILEAKK